MFKVKVFENKKGKVSRALVLRVFGQEYFLSFDTTVLCVVLDVTPSGLAALTPGYYDVYDCEEVDE